MNNAGDAAEQVVRLSLEGMEVSVKLLGKGAKEIAIILASALKQEINQSQKTSGKARLASMIKSGKTLNVFSIRQKDLTKFTAHAKQYGILYCVLKDSSESNPNSIVDIIVREDDAPRIQRIVERFEINNVELTDSMENDNINFARNTQEETEADITENPFYSRTEQSNPSEQNFVQDTTNVKAKNHDSEHKPSVKEKLKEYKNTIKHKNENSKEKNATDLINNAVSKLRAKER